MSLTLLSVLSKHVMVNVGDTNWKYWMWMITMSIQF